MLIDAKRPGARSRDRWSTRGLPWSRTAAMAVCQPTPKARATSATEWPSWPTRRQISARARSVSAAQGAISSTSSDHVVTGESGQGTARCAWPTPAPPGDSPSADPAPSPGAGHDRPTECRIPRTPPPRRPSPPPATYPRGQLVPGVGEGDGHPERAPRRRRPARPLGGPSSSSVRSVCIGPHAGLLAPLEPLVATLESFQPAHSSAISTRTHGRARFAAVGKTWHDRHTSGPGERTSFSRPLWSLRGAILIR
jgi:hypothetical protein